MTGLLLWCLLCVHGAGSLPAEHPDSALLPPDGFLDAWKKVQGPRVFAGADLYGYIDGGAEIFLEFGFEQLVVQRYARGDQARAASEPSEELQILAYRMTDPIAATGIYLMNCGKESPDPSFPERHTMSQHHLLFKRHQYYVIVNNLRGDSKTMPAMLAFGRAIASRLPAEEPLQLDQLLPKKDLDRNSIRLIRGPYGLQPVCTLGQGDILQLGRTITAVSGEYHEADGKSTRIIVEYPDEGLALKAFLHLQSNLDSYLKVVEKGDRRLVFRDYAGKYGVIALTGERLSIRVGLSKP